MSSLTFQIRNWSIKIAENTGILQSISPATLPGFDFAPSDCLSQRSAQGNYHTGDLTFRWRRGGESAWFDEDTSRNRLTQVSKIPSQESLFHCSLDGVFSEETTKSLEISRTWQDVDGDVVLRASVRNILSSSVEIGAFGFPLEFNNILNGRSADEMDDRCVFVDPYIGLGAGYVQVTRLCGKGPNMVITPVDQVSKFEAWRFLPESPDQPRGYQVQLNEGNYAWQTLTKAYAEGEWSLTDPWNEPTSVTIAPHESVSFAIRMSVAPNICDIEAAVTSNNIPVAVGLPGYVLPTDVVGQLYLTSSAPVDSIEVTPTKALIFTPVSARKPSLKAFKVHADPSTFGRVRVTIRYGDGIVQTVHYFVTAPTLETVKRLGCFLFHEQYFTDKRDPFHRAPSVISYDYEAKKQVLQDGLVYLAGLSDEGGAGAFETAAMKIYAHPTRDEVSKLEAMANEVVWGGLQIASGDQKYAVTRSIFYHDPEALPDYQYEDLDWSLGWNKSECNEVWRTFNAPHVAALWYSLYRADRVIPGVLRTRAREWYLHMAFETIRVCTTGRTRGDPARYANCGLLGESLWPGLIEDLRAENLIDEAAVLEKIMRNRQKTWASQPNPFGSEMEWDSTGQHAVYLWSRYFSDQGTMEKALDSIRGYMPTVAHWGWNGNARRYWDFNTAGKLRLTERMIHHYGSGLNSLPLLDAYRHYEDPASRSSFYDLRVAFAGQMGPLSNINSEGFASMAFHSFPDIMKWDAYSGDYGPNYLGHIQGSATYLVEHSDYGWVSMGGNLEEHGSVVAVSPKDTVRRQVFIAPVHLWIRFDGGMISEFQYDAVTKIVTVELQRPLDVGITSTLMFYEATSGSKIKLTSAILAEVFGGFQVEIPGKVTFSAS